MTDGSVWLERRVIAYAHQGGAWESPSSTLHAIRAALDAGANAIELDVHATLDGELVVCHDATVDRTTAASGTIASFTLAELRQLDFSYWWIPGADVTPDLPEAEYPFRGRAPGDPNFGIASLREVLEEFPRVILNLDIKQTAPLVPAYEETLARLLAEYGRTDDLMVASFLDPATDAFRSFAPDVPTSAGTVATAAFWQAVQAGEAPPDIPAVAYQVPERQGDLVIVNEAFVEAAHRSGKAVHVWTVNVAEDMERLLGLGVDGIISDVPTMLAGVLAAQGVGWNGSGGGR
jgi:glycerophosphoryl diester phosphodiesterase